MTDRPGAAEQQAPGRKQKEASLNPQGTKRGASSASGRQNYTTRRRRQEQGTPRQRCQGKDCKSGTEARTEGEANGNAKAVEEAHLVAHNEKGPNKKKGPEVDDQAGQRSTHARQAKASRGPAKQN